MLLWQNYSNRWIGSTLSSPNVPSVFFCDWRDGMWGCRRQVGTWCRSRACVLKWSCEDVSDGHIESRSIILLKDGCFQNGGTPKSSILMMFSIINHPFWGTPIFGNTQMLQALGYRTRILESNLAEADDLRHLSGNYQARGAPNTLLLWGSCAADTVDGNYPSCTTWDVKKHPVNSQINYVPIIRCRISSINIRLKFAEAFDAACVATGGNSQILDKLKDGFDQSPAWSGWF